MAEYRPATCAYCFADSWCETRANGKPQCRACKIERFYSEILYPPLGYSLMGWQRKVLRDIYGKIDLDTGERQYRSAYISVGKKNGKALSLSTPIPTPTGWTSMGDIRTGDSVFDERGAICKVIATGEVQTGRPCFEVTFSDGCKIVADAEHEWLTHTRKPKNKILIHTTAEIGASLRIESPGSAGANHAVAVSGAIQCPIADLPVPPYVLGAWLGDGTSLNATFTVSVSDAHILNEFEREGVCWHRFKSSGGSNSALTVRLGGKQGHHNTRTRPNLQRTLRISGLLGKKHIPAAYLRSSIDQRFALLQGLMDTDGYCSPVGQCEFTATNPRLAAGVLELLRTLGFKPTFYIHNATLNGRIIGPKIRIQFWPSKEPVFRLPRKTERTRSLKCDRTKRRHIISVTPTESVPVRCIQVDSPSHMFLAGESMIPTHNSFLIGGLPLYHLLMENEHNPEAYGAAAAKDQAAIVFRAASQLVQANPELNALLRVLPSTKRIVRRDGGGFYTVLSADGDVQDGVEPSLLIRDEIHRWKSARAETLKDVLTKGQISRSQPLDIAITTAGAEYESLLWWQEYQHAKRVLEGSVKNSKLYAAIWEADRKRIDTDPDYWKSREARVAGNPSHEDFEGGFLRDSALVGELDKALDEPSERSKYLRYHLNVPISQQEEPIIDMEAWKLCGGGEDLREWPIYDVDLLIRKWGLLDRPCWAGVDASWTTDLTAVVFVFPPFEGVEEWTLLPFFWMPEGRVPTLERICRVPYASWIDTGFIETTAGNGIDMRAVKDRIKWGREMFELIEVDFDRVNFRTQAMELLDDGIDTIEVTQTFLLLSHPTKFLLSSYVDQKIRHGNNPVLNWMASCMQLQYDRKDNCQPTKPERMKSAKRIDGLAATVTALSRSLVAEDTGVTATVRSVR